jgi:hypothetical protein
VSRLGGEGQTVTYAIGQTLLMLALMVFTCAMCAWLGYSICQLRHKQRGIEVDRWDQTFPDFPPASWFEEARFRRSHGE